MSVRHRLKRLEARKSQKKTEEHTCGPIIMFENFSGKETPPPIPSCVVCAREKRIRVIEFRRSTPRNTEELTDDGDA